MKVYLIGVYSGGGVWFNKRHFNYGNRFYLRR